MKTMKAMKKERLKSELKRLCKAQGELAKVRRSINNIMFTDDICNEISNAEKKLESSILITQDEVWAENF